MVKPRNQYIVNSPGNLLSDFDVELRLVMGSRLTLAAGSIILSCSIALFVDRVRNVRQCGRCKRLAMSFVTLLWILYKYKIYVDTHIYLHI